MTGIIIALIFIMVVFLLGVAYGKEGLNKIVQRETEALCIALRNVIHRKDKQLANLMAMACVSSGQCRRTPEEYLDILFKKMLDKESERRGEECAKDDCETCDPKDTVCSDDGEQEVADDKQVIKYSCNSCNDNNVCAETKVFISRPGIDCCDEWSDENGEQPFVKKNTQAVTDENKRAAESVSDVRDSSLINATADNPAQQKALDRCKSVKKACEESISMTPDERERVNGKIDN